MYSCWSRSSQGEEKGSLCPGYIWGSCHFPVGKKFPMLSSSIAAAASCQRKLKLDNSSCRFSFATSVQKNCQATKKKIYMFFIVSSISSSLIKKFFNYFFLFPLLFPSVKIHKDRNNFSFFFIFHVCNNARD